RVNLEPLHRNNKGTPQWRGCGDRHMRAAHRSTQSLHAWTHVRRTSAVVELGEDVVPGPWQPRDCVGLVGRFCLGWIARAACLGRAVHYSLPPFQTPHLLLPPSQPPRPPFTIPPPPARLASFWSASRTRRDSP